MNVYTAISATSNQASSSDLVWLILAGILLWVAVIGLVKSSERRIERRRLERLALTAVIVGGIVYWTRFRKAKNANKQDETQKHDTIRL